MAACYLLYCLPSPVYLLGPAACKIYFIFSLIAATSCIISFQRLKRLRDSHDRWVANFHADYSLNNPDTLTKYKQAAQISQRVLEFVTGTARNSSSNGNCEPDSFQGCALKARK